MNQPFANTTLGDIVAKDYHAAAIFERYGLDFCCGGRVSLADACRQHGVDVQAVSSELAHLARTPEETAPEAPDALIALIVSRHHAYVRDAIPSIQSHLAKVIAAHGRSHPEVIRIASHFDVIAEELTLHLAKEERVLFPYIHSLTVATQNGGPPPPDVFGTVQNPIRMMETEHQNAGDELAAIRSLTSDYKAPADACATYRLVYAELQAFERDLHRHVHLENNVLFPRAIELEAQITHKGRIGCESSR